MSKNTLKQFFGGLKSSRQTSDIYRFTSGKRVSGSNIITIEIWKKIIKNPSKPFNYT